MITMVNGVGRNQGAIALFEGLICIVLRKPGTVDPRTQGHIDGAPVSGDIIYGLRLHRHYSGVVNIGAV